MTARTRWRRGAAALALAAVLSGCADLAGSTGGPAEQSAAAMHTQVQTAHLVAEAGLQDPPAPAVTLTVILDEAETSLIESRERLANEAGGETELADLCDAAITAVRDLRAAVESGDREALRAADEDATAIGAAIEEWSGLL
jgi:hypothetical protein